MRLDHSRKTDCGVDGTYAQRSTVASRSSPEAAQRGAEGAGLYGDDRGRSTIKRAVLRSQVHQSRPANRHFCYTRNPHHIDGRDQIVPFENDADQDAVLVQWNQMTMCHPAAWAAGAYVIIGPTTTSYVDLSARTVTQSRTADGSWQPSALSDFMSLPG